MRIQICLECYFSCWCSYRGSSVSVVLVFLSFLLHFVEMGCRCAYTNTCETAKCEGQRNGAFFLQSGALFYQIKQDPKENSSPYITAQPTPPTTTCVHLHTCLLSTFFPLPIRQRLNSRCKRRDLTLQQINTAELLPTMTTCRPETFIHHQPQTVDCPRVTPCSFRSSNGCAAEGVHPIA